jgi:hypothetical protein
MSVDTNRIMEYLAKEGFRATLAAPGDIRFKYEGGQYMIRTAPKDDQYLSISFPNFWRIGTPEEEIRALRAANRVTQWIKVGKVYVLEEQHNVWADVELLVLQPEQFEALFPRALDILKAAAKKFVELMRASEPLPDKRVELKREEVTRWMHGN